MKLFTAVLALTVIPSLFAQVPAMPRVPSPPPPAAAPAPPPDPDKVVITVGDEKITEAQFEQLIETLPDNYRQAARGPQRRSFAEQIVQVTLLSQEGQKKKLDQDPSFKVTMDYQRKAVLANATVRELEKDAKVDDAAVEKYYNEHKTDFEVLKAKHILIRVKGAPMQARPGKPELSDEEALAKAQEIRKRLVAGGDFAAIAKEESDDAGSGAQGGELGEFKKGMMVPPFEQAAFAAKVNEVTEPVKTPFGYHLIVVESHVTKNLAEARPEIETKLRPQMVREQLDAMRKSATVKVDDGFFGPAQPAPGTPAASITK